MSYEVRKDEKVILKESGLGLILKDDRPIMEDLTLVRAHVRSFDETWETAWGEERFVRNNYNEAAFYLAENNVEKRLITMRFRVFDDGVAFRYEIPAQNKFRRAIIADEITEFAVDGNALAWKIPAYQPDRYEYNYEKAPVYSLDYSVHTPLTVELPNGHFMAIHEAALYDYGSMTIRLSEQGALKTDITPLADGTRAVVDLPWHSPWRTVIIAHSALDLTTSRMMLNLNEPAVADFSWVRPTKFMGIWWAMFVGEWTWALGERHGATTEHAVEYIDACRRLGIPALLMEGWNQTWEGDWLANGEKISFTESYPDFDMAKVAKYAREQGVEIVAHHETVANMDNYERQMGAAYEMLAKYGIHYVKLGYVGTHVMVNGRRELHHSQAGVRHYQKVVELAARYQVCLDIHEPIKGTGTERTWPNLLSREGARGQEYEGGALAPSHACIIPFTRLLSGGMDYTSGIFDVTNFTKRMATTLARQIAYYVTIFSGMQMAADRPRFYENEHPEVFKFIRDVAVSFERTVPLLGAIGEYYVVARQGRGEATWYVGGVTNEQGRRVRLSLDFLEEGSYVAEIYRDSDDAHYRDNQTGIVIEKKVVRKGEFIDVYMAPGGGFGMRVIVG
jgi:alpha-glucosidase